MRTASINSLVLPGVSLNKNKFFDKFHFFKKKTRQDRISQANIAFLQRDGYLKDALNSAKKNAKDFTKKFFCIKITSLLANVAELVDAPDLGSGAERCESSSLSVRTKFKKPLSLPLNGFISASSLYRPDPLKRSHRPSGIPPRPISQPLFAFVSLPKNRYRGKIRTTQISPKDSFTSVSANPA